jgi:hypothetical protein
VYSPTNDNKDDTAVHDAAVVDVDSTTFHEDTSDGGGWWSIGAKDESQ